MMCAFKTKIRVDAALSYEWMRPYATSVHGLKLLVYGALNYLLAERDGGMSSVNNVRAT